MVRVINKEYGILIILMLEEIKENKWIIKLIMLY